jgi:His/Glu/Gln/Arg/opine family amino acid ABC transporter permease subunit
VRPGPWAVFLIPEIQRFLLEGLLTTLELAAVTVILSAVIGTFLATTCLLPFAWLRLLVGLYLDIARSLPTFLIVVYVYLALPRLGLEWPPLVRVAVALLLYHGARQAEVIRAGILSIPRGESDAARSLGLTSVQTFSYVILPQAVRRILPSLTTESVLAVKNTSLGLVVGVTELMNRGMIIFAKFYNPMETLLLIGSIYFVLCFSLSQLSRRLGMASTGTEAM